MDITHLIVSRRNDALLVGDYGSYREKLTRRLLTLRRQLGRTSPKGKKYANKAPITAEDIEKNPEFAHLLVLTAERAWAHAMYMKSMHAADSADKAITGSTKKHIVSRLRRALQQANHLAKILSEFPDGTAPPTTRLEAMAYESMLQGTLLFEAQRWERSLAVYAEAYVAYSALSKASEAGKGDSFQELVSSTIEPSLRYAAYQLRLPRTLSIQLIVARYASKDAPVVKAALELSPSALDDPQSSAPSKQTPTVSASDVPKDIRWRQRTVPLEDAAIAQALGTVAVGESHLTEVMSNSSIDSAAKAAAYDAVLNPSQDAVDATTTALAELAADGVPAGDSRMQALQITRTATNYALVGWRIGRNRVLCGADDGLQLERFEAAHKKTASQTVSSHRPATREVGTARQLARLRERVALLDSTLQSLDSIRSLPGVAADGALLKELASRRAYFGAVRCANVGHGHVIMGSVTEALALYVRALSQARAVVPDKEASHAAPNLEVSPKQAQALVARLDGLADQHRALAHLAKTGATGSVGADASSAHPHDPWVEHLNLYPEPGKALDLTRLVDYPPRLRPIPVKPIFLDLAWNYINYPGAGAESSVTKAVDTAKEAVAPVGDTGDKNEDRKGWFSSWRK